MKLKISGVSGYSNWLQNIVPKGAVINYDREGGGSISENF